MEGNQSADDVTVRSEMMLPEAIIENHNLLSIFAELLLAESRSQERCHSKQRQEILRNECSVDLLRRHRLPRVAQVLRGNAISRNVRKHAIALTQIAKCRAGYVRRALMVLLQSHDLTRLPQRQRTE